MNSETKILGIILFFSVLLIGGGIFFLSKQTPSNSLIGDKVYDINYSLGQKVGSDSAKVKLVEFSDFQCPACGAAEPFVTELREAKNPNVQIIYRHFPLNRHRLARMAANVAEAAGEQGKFWQMHDKIFETQLDWPDLDNPVDFFVNLAKSLGLEENKIREAAENSTYNNKIEADFNEGLKLSVNSTPTFYLNGRKLNIQNFAQLKTVIGQTLQSNP